MEPGKTSLTLQRNCGETIVIDGGRIIIRVSDISDGVCKLRFYAKRSVSIKRGELCPEVLEAAIEEVPPGFRHDMEYAFKRAKGKQERYLETHGG